MHRLHLTEDQHILLTSIMTETLEIELDSFNDDPQPEQGYYIEKLRDLEKALRIFESV